MNIKNYIRPITVSLATGIYTSQLPFFVEKYHLPADLSPSAAFVAATAVSLALMLINSKKLWKPIFERSTLACRVFQYAKAFWLDKWMMDVPKIVLMTWLTYTAFNNIFDVSLNISAQETALFVGALYVIHRIFDFVFSLGTQIRNETQPKKWVRPITIPLAVGYFTARLPSLLGQYSPANQLTSPAAFVTGATVSLALILINSSPIWKLLEKDAPFDIIRTFQRAEKMWLDNWVMESPKIFLLSGITYGAINVLGPRTSVKETALLMGAIYLYHVAFQNIYDFGVRLREKQENQKKT